MSISYGTLPLGAVELVGLALGFWASSETESAARAPALRVPNSTPVDRLAMWQAGRNAKVAALQTAWPEHLGHIARLDHQASCPGMTLPERVKDYRLRRERMAQVDACERKLSALG